jgi:uncharacterized membrane protein YjjP (DUF1212 family)
VEGSPEKITRSLGFDGVFRSNTSEIVFAIQERPNERQIIHVEAVPAPGMALDKLGDISRLADRVLEGEIDVADARDQLVQVDSGPRPWGGVSSALSRSSTVSSYGAQPMSGSCSHRDVRSVCLPTSARAVRRSR